MRSSKTYKRETMDVGTTIIEEWKKLYRTSKKLCRETKGKHKKTDIKELENKLKERDTIFL